MAIFQFQKSKKNSHFLFDLISKLKRTFCYLFSFWVFFLSSWLQEAEKQLICMQCGAPAWRTLSLRRAAKELSALAVAIQPNGAVRSWSDRCTGLIGLTMPPRPIMEVIIMVVEEVEPLLLLLVETDGNGAVVRLMYDQEHLWPNDSPTREKPKETAGVWWICTIIKPVEKWVTLIYINAFDWVIWFVLYLIWYV